MFKFHNQVAVVSAEGMLVFIWYDLYAKCLRGKIQLHQYRYIFVWCEFHVSKSI